MARNETMNMDIDRYLDCAKLKPGRHELVVALDGKAYNLAIKKDCASVAVHRWDYGVGTGSRYDDAAHPAWATLGASAVLNPGVILHLEEIAQAIATINHCNTSIGLGIKTW